MDENYLKLAIQIVKTACEDYRRHYRKMRRRYGASYNFPKLREYRIQADEAVKQYNNYYECRKFLLRGDIMRIFNIDGAELIKKLEAEVDATMV